MRELQFYRQAFNDHLADLHLDQEPSNLYQPIKYILELGGKRLRPVLTLMSSELFGGNHKQALNAALAIEVFHNFTLLHDDIMDDAPLRRGHQTVHEKWDLNTGILSGDAMLIMAYQFLQGYPSELLIKLLVAFNKTALEICEGQQYDVDFETRNDVVIEEYLKMIEYKTAVLVGTALKFGAIIAGASDSDQDLIEQFGINLGIAFQLQDDYLDAFGNPESFGKQVGGDILENKKTILYIKAVELGSTDQVSALLTSFKDIPEDPKEKVEQVKIIYKESGAADASRDAIENFTSKAFDFLDSLSVSDTGKSYFKAFGKQLMNRTY
ncbi:MAG: polyprenyl synthetase family protein [Flavobacteriaceae bacterium]|nr:polyprenyl synthetase family protein [Bacteroidia bacterium]MBT8288424.1 polyprenyl synthetase family protein [Bacteroidia bacterium]NNF73744.1 polyprenyl synthetase family protein [Flavobacteriaceae bacterium]NNK73305.1 polyprenyl synthetase family protein [Flavobacteriaceae bacterium]